MAASSRHEEETTGETAGDDKIESADDDVSERVGGGQPPPRRPVVVVVGASSKFGKFATTTAAATEEDDASTSTSTSNTNEDDSRRWGLGGALAVRFAKSGYDVVLMGRRMNVLNDIRNMVLNDDIRKERDGGDSDSDSADTNADTTTRAQQQRQRHQVQVEVLCAECDVTDDDSVRNAFEYARETILKKFDGYIDLVVYNVAPKFPPNFKFEGWGDVLVPHKIDTTNSTLQYDTSVNGLLRCAKQCLPEMIERNRGCVLVSGESCCNLHGRYEFGSVAPARAAQRSLTQSMFHAYGPMGIHVCNVNIGGIIDTPTTRTWETARDSLVDPHEIAEVFLHAYRQKSTVWSYEIQLTPSLKSRNGVDTRM